MSPTVAEAVHGRLQELLSPDPAFDGHVPMSTQGQPQASRYAVLWADAGRRHSEDVAGALRDVVVRFRVHNVGVSAVEARHLSQMSSNGLVLWTPPVDGLVLGRVEHESTDVPERQDQMPRPLFVVRDRYVVRGYRLT